MVRVDDHSQDRYAAHGQEAIYEIVLPLLFYLCRELWYLFNLTHTNSFLLDKTPLGLSSLLPNEMVRELRE